MYKYNHVVVVGIDGAGNFYRDADTPTIHGLFKMGAGSDRVLTSIPTISAECWGSMLIGVAPDKHGLTNDIVSSEPYESEQYPTVFKLIRDALPDSELGAFCNWSPINAGIVERGVGVTFETGDDGILTDKICDYIKTTKPTFLFVQFDSIDGAGHAYGYGTEKYLAELARADGYVRRIQEAIDEAGIADDTLFIVTADHGGHGHSHGGTTDEEKYVFFVAVGKNVPAGARIELEVKDIPAIVIAALGVENLPDWDAKLPEGLFAD